MCGAIDLRELAPPSVGKGAADRVVTLRREAAAFLPAALLRAARAGPRHGLRVGGGARCAPSHAAVRGSLRRAGGV